MKTVYIAGESGTSGMVLHSLLQDRTDLRVLSTPAQDRQALERDTKLLNTADVVVLCVPTSASASMLARITNPAVRVIDNSSAHSVADGWVYGLPELHATQREAIRNARRVSGPGCFATGFILAVRPLLDAGLLVPEAVVTPQGIGGYSAGGKKMVARFEQTAKAAPLVSVYGLNFDHPHVAEMQHYTGLQHAPLFVPCVGAFPQGMLVTVPLPRMFLHPTATLATVRDVLQARYAGECLVTVGTRRGLSPALSLLPTQGPGVELFVEGNDTHLLLVARLNNLGKGSALASVQNINLLLGLDEYAGIPLSP